MREVGPDEHQIRLRVSSSQEKTKGLMTVTRQHCCCLLAGFLTVWQRKEQTRPGQELVGREQADSEAYKSTSRTETTQDDTTQLAYGLQ